MDVPLLNKGQTVINCDNLLNKRMCITLRLHGEI